MFEDALQNPFYIGAGAFAAGWLVAKISAWMGRRLTSAQRDPRDDRIRSMEADLRVARSETQKAQAAVEAQKKDLAELTAKSEEQVKTVREQLAEINKLRVDLKASVRKTHELRTELSDRAEENLRSTVRLRDVETELSVARASTDLLSTGVLDYNMDDDDEADETSQIFKSGS